MRGHENGILYYYDLDLHTDFKIGMMGMRSPLSTIGLQVFPRSGAQYGFLYAMEREEDFNNVDRLHAVRFKHRTSASKKYNDFFHSGRDLFPDDILAKHWKIRIIKLCLIGLCYLTFCLIHQVLKKKSFVNF